MLVPIGNRCGGRELGAVRRASYLARLAAGVADQNSKQTPIPSRWDGSQGPMVLQGLAMALALAELESSKSIQ